MLRKVRFLFISNKNVYRARDIIKYKSLAKKGYISKNEEFCFYEYEMYQIIFGKCIITLNP